MTNLWERLVHIYGHKWSSTYGVSAIEGGKLTDVALTWASGLIGVTGEQIADGLHACCDSGYAWPPTLPEFRALCLKAGKNEYGLNYVPAYYRQQIRENSRLLSSAERDATRKKSRDHIQKMRETLGIKKPG